ncbi:MAG: hypothetical protein ACRDKZ_08845 [Actinomycetota bacterium]
MRKAIVSLFVVGLLAGPLANFANAGPICTLYEKLGIDNVKECEEPPF